MQPNVVKMNKPFISLCPEITRADALMLMDWLEDESVTRYLSDSRHVSRFIEQLIGRVQLPILTHLFNQGGASSWPMTGTMSPWASCAW